MTTKICTKCGVEYPAIKEYFHSEKRNKNGLHSWCRKCKNTADADWRKNNPEKYQKGAKKCRQKNKEKYYKSQQDYRKTIKGYLCQLVSTIKRRCTDRTYPEYRYWGGRGIKCLFTSNSLFNWVTLNNIDPRGLDIHRIDNDGNYTLDNIEFLTKSEHSKLHHSQKRNDENP